MVCFLATSLESVVKRLLIPVRCQRLLSPFARPLEEIQLLAVFRVFTAADARPNVKLTPVNVKRVECYATADAIIVCLAVTSDRCNTSCIDEYCIDNY